MSEQNSLENTSLSKDGSGLNIAAQNSNPNTHNISNSPQMPENVHDLIDVPEGEGREIEGEKPLGNGSFEFGPFDPFELNHDDEPPLKKTKVEESFIPSNDKSTENNEPEDSKKDNDLVADEASVTKSHEIKPEDDPSLQIDSLIPDGMKDNSSNNNPELQIGELVSSSDKSVHSKNKDSEAEANAVLFENNDKLQIDSFIPENINHLDPKAEKSVDTIEPTDSSEESNGKTGTNNVQEKSEEDHISPVKEGSQGYTSTMQSDQSKDGITSQHEERSHPATKPDESDALIEFNKQKILQHEQASMNESTSESAVPTEAPLTHDPVQKPSIIKSEEQVGDQNPRSNSNSLQATSQPQPSSVMPAKIPPHSPPLNTNDLSLKMTDQNHSGSLSTSDNNDKNNLSNNPNEYHKISPQVSSISSPNLQNTNSSTQVPVASHTPSSHSNPLNSHSSTSLPPNTSYENDQKSTYNPSLPNPPSGSTYPQNISGNSTYPNIETAGNQTLPPSYSPTYNTNSNPITILGNTPSTKYTATNQPIYNSSIPKAQPSIYNADYYNSPKPPSAILYSPYPANTSIPYSPGTRSLPPTSAAPPIPAPPPMPIVKRDRLVILYDYPRFAHMKSYVENVKNVVYENTTVLEMGSLDKLKGPEFSQKKFEKLSFAIEYNDEFESNLKAISDFIETKPKVITDAEEIAYHFHFDHRKKWAEYRDYEKQEYKRFLDVLNKVAGSKVVQCSIINKYELHTVYLTERNDLAQLGQEIQEDIQNWPNLKIFDYADNYVRFLPGVRFPNSLEVINMGGGYSLETLSGFKMPPNLKTLNVNSGSITSIDNIVFPITLERLSLSDNKIYFLNSVDFPSRLTHLDISQNRIETLKNVNFPRNLKSLSVSFNPIENIRGVKFPEGLEYLDLSCIPNESMTGVKFPDLLISLNLQQSMANTRGLKLPAFVKKINLSSNGVNSINPLKLPNSIESLYLSYNNIKTLNKVIFPTTLKELYLGNNLITTLKNVQFPVTLEVLDLEMDPDVDEQEKHITTLKDVVLPPNLKTLKLGYHSIKFIETIDFPVNLEYLSLAYNELKVIRNVRFGPNLKTLDLSGNQELTSIDNLIIPESVTDLRIPSQLVNYLPIYIVERANSNKMVITKSEPFI